VADLNAAGGAELEQAHGAQVRFVETDVVDALAAERAVAAAVEQFGALHILVSCAGVANTARIVGREGPHDLQLFARVVQINLIGTFNMLRLAAAAMAQNQPQATGERGVIINTASVAAFDGQIGQAAYAASKAGVAGLTLPAARELARIGVRVVSIAPGLFDTPMLAGMSEQVRASLGQQVPFPPRLGQPDEFAALAQHIIENPMLNGETIRLDGAIRMAPK
jgi:NAD(P)-dependent dehydrogenase (short-subunit alcohol dehydrogenase family)